MDGLRNPPGVLGVDRNVFEAKDVFLGASGPTPAQNLLGANAGNRAKPGVYELVVERVATAHKIAADPVSSDSQPLAHLVNGGSPFSGTFEIGLSGGATAQIAVDGTMDLRDVEAAINAVADTTGVRASILKVSDGDHRLVLSAQGTGRAITLQPVSGDDVPELLGLTSGGVIKNELRAAQTARFSIDGVVMERSSNLVEDAIPGVKINLFAADPSTTVTLEVAPSAGAAMEAVRGLVDAYNALRDFVETHRRIDENGQVAEEAVLFADSALREVERMLTGEVGTAVRGGDGSATLASVGITLDSANRLRLDAAKLEAALASDPEAVRRVFEFRWSAGSPDLAVYARTNALSDFSFDVAITDSDGDGVIESATIDGVAAEVNGGRIVGPAGTPYEGLELLWVGRGSTTIHVEASQGIADRLYNAIDRLLADDGAVGRRISAIEEENRRYQQEIARIDERVESYRQHLIEKFTKLESTLALLSGMLKQVDAATQAMFGKRG
ncbi:Flagellar hook-associated protein 2 [bacterium HR39]|nr:Flagellar hook-associated protein 2 [bacterium HR39]